MLFPYADEQKPSRLPIITLLLIAANLTTFLYAINSPSTDKIYNEYGFTPASLLQHPEQLVTSLFLHSGVWHLVSNMWFLGVFGGAIEERFGSLPFLSLYLISGVAGNLIHAAIARFDSTLPLVGASGAVAGVMGSYIIRYPLGRIRSILLVIFWPIRMRVPALLLLGFWFAVEFSEAFLGGGSDRVAHWAHVGGFMLGAGWTWSRRGKYHRARGIWW